MSPTTSRGNLSSNEGPGKDPASQKLRSYEAAWTPICPHWRMIAPGLYLSCYPGKRTSLWSDGFRFCPFCGAGAAPIEYKPLLEPKEVPPKSRLQLLMERFTNYLMR